MVRQHVEIRKDHVCRRVQIPGVPLNHRPVVNAASGDTGASA